MIIIIEGPRGTGKTTACNFIKRKMHYLGVESKIVKFPYLKNGFTEQIIVGQNKIDQQPDSSIFIADRWHVTEWVNGTALNRRDPQELLNDTMLLGELLEKSHHTVSPHILSVSTDTIVERLSERKEEDRKQDIPIELVRPLWHHASSMFKIPIHLNYCDEDMEKLFSKVWKIAKNIKGN